MVSLIGKIAWTMFAVGGMGFFAGLVLDQIFGKEKAGMIIGLTGAVVATAGFAGLMVCAILWVWL